MREVQRFQPPQFPLAERLPMAGYSQSDARQRSIGHLTDREYRTLRGSVPWNLRSIAAQGQGARLGNPGASLNFYRIGQRERRAVRLVGGIRPVPLIFHLKGVALEADLRSDTRDDLVGDRPHVHERLMGRD